MQRLKPVSYSLYRKIMKKTKRTLIYLLKHKAINIKHLTFLTYVRGRTELHNLYGLISTRHFFTKTCILSMQSCLTTTQHGFPKKKITSLTLKLVSANFYQFFIFSPYDSLSKTTKIDFHSI